MSGEATTRCKVHGASHDWFESTAIGDQDRLFVCACGAQRIEEGEAVAVVEPAIGGKETDDGKP